MELLERCVDCKLAISALVPPADLSDPQAVRTLLEVRRRARQRYFDPNEQRALFGAEEELDRFTLRRLEISRQTNLDRDQKAAAVRSATLDLSEMTQKARSEAVRHLEVATQTSSFEAPGIGEAERYEQRRKAYGDETAARLSQLNREQREWDARPDPHAAALREQPPQDQTRLRSELFAPTEQLRLEGALRRRTYLTKSSSTRER